MKRFFARSRHNLLLSPFLFVFVGPIEHWGLESFGSLWHATAVGIQTFFKERKTGAKFWGCGMDANPIRVAPECQDTAGSYPSVSWCFWLMGIFSKMIREYMRKGC
jgi:hypothetical protein